MAHTPPPFGSQSYWDDRFTTNPTPFEWLENPDSLNETLEHAILALPQHHDPKILHIGCGTSLLSFHLRSFVQNPARVHNVDYSSVAIDIGRAREAEIFDTDTTTKPRPDENHHETVNNDRSPENNTDASNGIAPTSAAGAVEDRKSTSCMLWSAADLLRPMSVSSLDEEEKYDIIVDKSTSDSIACGEDIEVRLPYPFYTGTGVCEPRRQWPEPIHPIHVLAIHLARLANPGAFWLCLSYSGTRFPFLRPPTKDLEDIEALPFALIQLGFPDPARLWTLEARVEIPVKEKKNETLVHRPKVVHYLYVLKRTNVPLGLDSNLLER